MEEIKSNIKVVEKIGNKPGKTTVILVGIHGNETPGIKAFDRLIPEIKIEFGKVIFIYANLEAIRQNKRLIEKNLNRCFFKQQSVEIAKSLEGKTAKQIIPYLDSADLVLDLHASFTKDSMPFVICDEKQLKNADIFDCEIVSYNWDPFEPGSTDNYMNLQNKPGFCFECGYLNDNKSIEIAEKTINNFLIFAGNIDGRLINRSNQRYLKIRYIYKNKEKPFKKIKDFRDFTEVSGETIIGIEGDKLIAINKGDILLFLRDSENLNEECFLIAEETLLNNLKLNKSKEGKLT